jgi:gluconate 2-dehydrogenase alpha chain
MLHESMTRQGYHPFLGPAGMISQPYKGRPACSYCGFCTGFGCWNDSKSGMHVSAIPEAEKTGKLEIRTNSRVTKILSNDKGEVTGVTYVDDQGKEQDQAAGIVILSAFIYENLRLLFLSKANTYPDGLVNNHGQVGKNYMTHSFLGSLGLFPGHRLNVDSGTGAQGVSIDDLNGNNFDHTGLGFIRGGVTTVAGETRPIAMSNTLPPDTPQWGAAYRTFLEENAQSIGSVVSQLEVLSYEANFADLDPQKKDSYGIPVLRLTFDHYENERKLGAYLQQKQHEILKAAGATKIWGGDAIPNPISDHAYGGARMGDDPSSSVVNKYSQAHEAPNLFILGGATYPSTAGYNPTLTLEALAWMSAEYLAKNLDSIAV